MIKGACAWSPDSLSFVIQRMKKKKKRKKSRKHSSGFFLPREKIINAFIDSIKMKDYCNASRSFAHVAKGQKEKEKRAFGMRI